MRRLVTERNLLLFICVAAIAFGAFDVYEDLRDGASWFHVISEVALAGLCGLALIYLFYQKRNQTEALQNEITELKQNAKIPLNKTWEQIDFQFETWHLSNAEKEIASLLLKGCSARDIAEARHTSEKTVKTQAANIYAKSGLKGRSELAAYFLDEMVQPDHTP